MLLLRVRGLQRPRRSAEEQVRAQLDSFVSLSGMKRAHVAYLGERNKLRAMMCFLKGATLTALEDAELTGSNVAEQLMCETCRRTFALNRRTARQHLIEAEQQALDSESCLSGAKRAGADAYRRWRDADCAAEVPGSQLATVLSRF